MQIYNIFSILYNFHKKKNYYIKSFLNFYIKLYINKFCENKK